VQTGHRSADLSSYSDRNVSWSVSQRTRTGADTDEDEEEREGKEEEEEGTSDGMMIESTDR